MNVLFDIGFRIVAIGLCIYSGYSAWHGLIERKISLYNTDFLDFFTPAEQVFHRDAAPIRYWLIMSLQAGGMVLFFIAALVGYWQPNS
jgi:hypothetical protein